MSEAFTISAVLSVFTKWNLFSGSEMWSSWCVNTGQVLFRPYLTFP